MTERLIIGRTTIDCHPCGLTVTTLHDGEQIHARAQDDATYRARAEALGYGDDTARMSREHEALHAMLAHWLGLPESPTLRGVASGQYWPHWIAEEEAILGIQRFARMAGVDVMRLAGKSHHG